MKKVEKDFNSKIEEIEREKEELRGLADIAAEEARKEK